MFEFEVQSLTHIRLRVGRLNLRTWRLPLMVSPRGYRSPDVVYSVVGFRDDGEIGPHIATFYSEKAAEECMRQLQAEGWGELALDLSCAYFRPSDWQSDR